jgi:hypothetical protein
MAVARPPNAQILDSLKISSAVSTALRSQEYAVGDAVAAERCGYGDLQ